MTKEMSSAWVGVALVWLATVVTLPVRADDLADTGNAIEAQYARLGAAIVGKDLSAIDGLVVPDVRFFSAKDEEQDLGQWKKAWEQIAASLEAVTLRHMVQSVAVEGDAALVVVNVLFDATINQAGSSVRLRIEDSERDAWVRIGTEWRLQRSEAIRTRLWLNETLVEDVTARPPLQPALREAIVGEIRARAAPFKDVTAGAGFDDLAVLDRVIGDARIVALGEATHGTAEFFRMKHRLFEYLVEKKGFTVIAFEAHWPDVEIADRYVKTGQGDAAAALRKIGFWVWSTEEVRDLIEWIRTYNSAPGRRKMLSFSGFDMQDPGEAIKCVSDAFGRLGSSEAETIGRYYDGAKDMYQRQSQKIFGEETGNPISDDETAQLRAKAADALKLVDARREDLLRILTPAEFRRVRQCAVIVVQASLPGASGVMDVLNLRDRAMARNVEWLAEEAFANEKIVLWAHNGHVAMASGVADFVNMGQHLRQIYGDEMLAVGFAFDRGEVRSIPLMAGRPGPGEPVAIEIPAAKPASAEALMRETGLSRFILDLRAVPAGSPLGAWLAEPQALRTIGSMYNRDNHAAAYERVPLGKAFDALVFIEESSATAPLK